eukprot:scaffold64749_cov28-Tisochrysis_lutea.AAC.13
MAARARRPHRRRRCSHRSSSLRRSSSGPARSLLDSTCSQWKRVAHKLSALPQSSRDRPTQAPRLVLRQWPSPLQEERPPSSTHVAWRRTALRVAYTPEPSRIFAPRANASRACRAQRRSRMYKGRADGAWIDLPRLS